MSEQSVAEFLAGTDDPSLVPEEPQEFAPAPPIGVIVEREVEEFVTTETGETRPVCQEEGCQRPCRKRKNSPNFFPYCAKHNALHTGSAMASPKSQGYEELEKQRKKAVLDVTNSVIGFFQPIQLGLAASDDWYCATALSNTVPPMAQALGDLSEDFPWLQKAVGTVDKWAALTQFCLAVLKLGVMVSVHHEWLPYEGVVRFLAPPPDSIRPGGAPLTVVPDASASFT